MPDKLTDAEVKKALECCIKSSHFGECFENECPLVSEKGCKVGKETLYPYALDLINRQDQENESLKAEVERLKYCNEANISTIATLHERLKSAKAEAYKECIEKVEQIICDNTYPDFDINHKAVNIWKAEAYKKINNILNELVGDDNFANIDKQN